MMEVPQLHGFGPTANRLLEAYKMLLKENINKKLSVSEDAAEELLSDGKKHALTWLHGRCHNAAKVSSITNSSTNTYVQELAGKIRQILVSEVESSVAKYKKKWTRK